MHRTASAPISTPSESIASHEGVRIVHGVAAEEELHTIDTGRHSARFRSRCSPGAKANAAWHSTHWSRRSSQRDIEPRRATPRRDPEMKPRSHFSSAYGANPRPDARSVPRRCSTRRWLRGMDRAVARADRTRGTPDARSAQRRSPPRLRTHGGDARCASGRRADRGGRRFAGQAAGSSSTGRIAGNPRQSVDFRPA